jgi:circadian clock protein KaiC
LSVVKQRTGGHETTVRELMLGPPEGLKLGPALKELEGVLMGNPRYVGDGGARSDGELVDR